MVGQVVEATLDETHSYLSVGEPTDERTQQLLCFINQPLRQMNLETHTDKFTTSLFVTKRTECCSLFISDGLDSFVLRPAFTGGISFVICVFIIFFFILLLGNTVIILMNLLMRKVIIACI